MMDNINDDKLVVHMIQEFILQKRSYIMTIICEKRRAGHTSLISKKLMNG